MTVSSFQFGSITGSVITNRYDTWTVAIDDEGKACVDFDYTMDISEILASPVMREPKRTLIVYDGLTESFIMFDVDVDAREANKWHGKPFMVCVKWTEKDEIGRATAENAVTNAMMSVSNLKQQPQ